MSALVEHEVRKVCGRGHALGWRPWYRSRGRTAVGHCMCGSPWQLEHRGPAALDKRALTAAGDWIAIEAPDLAERAEALARIAVRAYLNEIEDAPHA